MAATDVCTRAHDVPDDAVVDVPSDKGQTRDPGGRSPQRGEQNDLGWGASGVGRLCERSTVHTLDGAPVAGTLAADQHAVEYSCIACG